MRVMRFIELLLWSSVRRIIRDRVLESTRMRHSGVLSRAVIDRPYSKCVATVRALYERPRSITMPYFTTFDICDRRKRAGPAFGFVRRLKAFFRSQREFDHSF